MKTQEIKPPVDVLKWVGDSSSGYLRLLDQTMLPSDICYMDCKTPEQVWDAIKRLVVRGAPAIGVAAAYGMVVVAQKIDQNDDIREQLLKGADFLDSSRPTAVNLKWALREMVNYFDQTCTGLSIGAVRDKLLEKASEIHSEDTALCLSIGNYAADLICNCESVLTHCNAGALATAGIGTATAGMYVANARGHKFTVFCDETRPLLQGSRLTAWELSQANIYARVITDSMSAWVMKQGMVDMIITGADRIAANGDAANKIGTYGLAILAKYHNIPFYVAAPYSTFDLSIKTGDDIPIEQRSSEEIIRGFGKLTAPEDISTYSPAFDVTPADLIAGIITDRGIITSINSDSISNLIGD